MKETPDEAVEEKSEKKYSIADLEIFNILQHPVFIFDTEKFRILWANKSALIFWNADSLGELLSRDFQEGLSETARRRIKDLGDRMGRGEAMIDQWTAYPKGQPKQLAMTASGIRMEDGRISALVETELLNDKEFEKRATRNVEILRYLPMAVCQYDVEGLLRYQNPEALGVFGAETVDDQVSDFVARFVDQKVGKSVLEKVKVEGDHSLEVQQYTANKIPKHFFVSVRKTKDPITTEPIILYSAREMTEVMEAREESRKVKIKSDLIAVVSHQIRTPLHHIVGHLDLMESAGLPAHQLEFVKAIQRACSILMVVTNDLSDFATLESGKMKFENRLFCPDSVLKACISTVTKTAKEKGLDVVEDITGLPKALLGDPDRLRQVLLNILDNALKFTDSGSVTLKASVVNADQETICLRFGITDTGIGIHQQNHERIFRQYEQGSVTDSIKYGGTGLGLSLSKSLTEAMGGNISVQSVVGEGTAFTLEIPFGIPPRPTPETTTASTATSSPKPNCTTDQSTISEDKSNRTILIVEDNIVNQKMLSRMLQRMGHESVVACNGKVAVEEVSKKRKFDLILMDVCMPVLDGIDATKQIRELGFSKSMLPIVGLTASFQKSELSYYEKVGMNHCIGKPATMRTLKEVIATYAGRAGE